MAPISPETRERFSLKPDQRGVVIMEVSPDSPAAERELRPGDVIVEVGQEPVDSPDDVTSRIDQARQAGRKNVLMLLSRQGELRFVPLPLEG